MINSIPFKAKQYKEALIETFIEIDKQLMEEWEMSLITENNVRRYEGGTTTCVALITEREVYVANCGDSRCVLSNKGTAIQMSKDHKLSSKVERNRIIRAGGTIEAGRIDGILALPRSIGDLKFKSNQNLEWDEQIVIAVPDVKVENLNDVDFIFIACDGVWDCIGCQELVNLFSSHINENEKLSKTIGKLFNKILPDTIDGSRGTDNMTGVIIKLKWWMCVRLMLYIYLYGFGTDYNSLL